jgi:hypothetical protein
MEYKTKSCERVLVGREQVPRGRYNNTIYIPELVQTLGTGRDNDPVYITRRSISRSFKDHECPKTWLAPLPRPPLLRSGVVQTFKKHQRKVRGCDDGGFEINESGVSKQEYDGRW